MLNCMFVVVVVVVVVDDDVVVVVVVDVMTCLLCAMSFKLGSENGAV